jgi:hypothetical protein
MKKIFFLIFILFINSIFFSLFANSNEQEKYSGQSIFEDRNGNSAIFLPDGGTIKLNLADASARLSFIDKVSNRNLFFGLDVSCKTIDGISTLISKGNISPGIKIVGIFGIKELFKTSNNLDGWLVFKVGYIGSSFKLFDPQVIFSDQIEKKSFSSFTTELSFNLKLGGNKILAISSGFQKANNYDDLDDISLTDQHKYLDPDTNTTRIYDEKFNAKIGEYKTFNLIPVNIDFFWAPIERIGFYHFWRSKFINEEMVNGIGSGVFLLKKRNLLNSIAGIVVEIKDISKLKDGFVKSVVVNIVVGYNFKIN